ncbi:MAG: hypothetical protein HUJ31_01295 [Pseudomonadales bacterium]|nr:hypothetical protein [Pseudomonadales bacterium]
MDIQRIVILVGLAITSYLLILAWNEDYGQTPPVEPESTEIVGGSDVSTVPDDMQIPEALPEAADNTGAEVVPVIEDETPTVTRTDNKSRQSRVVRVETDVLDV